MKVVGMVLALMVVSLMHAQKVVEVNHFDKLIVSPHIQVTIIKGEKESVKIISNTEDDSKLNIEVKGKDLRIFLDDAKELTKQEKVSINGNITKKPIYHGTVVIAEVTYIELKDLSIRGEETFQSQGEFIGENLDLTIYGDSKVFFDQINLTDLDATLYGEGYLELKSGIIKDQKFTGYGASKIDVLNIENEETKLTAYGEAQFEINAKNRLKITSYGQPTIRYKGNPEINKGLNFGGVKISRID
ncbi:Putative auto-transporter adhesin, head GIN domain [Flavobacteriaceae bacterium MAR_2010_188]|nr:Putative auto-transporter adhesin, head GIN domain [Flavobacteriaceae bacterium MAR_2010_188]